MKVVVATQSRTIKDHSARIRQLEAGPGQPGGYQMAASGRRLQQPPSSGEVVHIHRISVAIPEGPGWRASGNYNGGSVPLGRRPCVVIKLVSQGGGTGP
eukprot:COSAG01_NODE_60121_length_296_cov_1.030457_1_plen_98_part_11